MHIRLPFFSEKHVSAEWVWAEVRKLVKFGLVGGSSFVIYIACYTAFRFTWPQGDYTLMTFVSSALASTYNFSLHRFWTFRSSASVGMAAMRYVMVLSFCTALQTGLFFIGYELLNLFDYLVQFLVAAPVAITSYILHRMFTFHARYSK